MAVFTIHGGQKRMVDVSIGILLTTAVFMSENNINNATATSTV